MAAIHRIKIDVSGNPSVQRAIAAVNMHVASLNIELLRAEEQTDEVRERILANQRRRTEAAWRVAVLTCEVARTAS